MGLHGKWRGHVARGIGPVRSTESRQPVQPFALHKIKK
jgi:hypothetical protein